MVSYSSLISELAVSVICFLGLFVGLVIGYFAKEELKPGKKFFLLLQKALFVLVVFVLFFEFDIWFLGLLLLIFFSIILFYLQKDYHRLVYFVLALFLMISFFNSPSIIPLFVFFYGFPTGSLFILDCKETKLFGLAKQSFISYFWFLVIVVLWLLIMLIF